MPAFQCETKSPCHSCEHLNEDKKRFPDCVNCLKRLGIKTKFVPKKAQGGFTKRMKPLKPCTWPHGCDDFSVKADYCSLHQRLIQDRRRRWKKKGFTDAEMEPFLTAPVQKGPNADPLRALQRFKLP